MGWKLINQFYAVIWAFNPFALELKRLKLSFGWTGIFLQATYLEKKKVSVVSLPEIFIWRRIFYDVVQLGFFETMAQVSYENWATQTSIERLSALTSRPLFLSWVVVVSVCSPPCPWYTPHSVGPSLCPELRDVIPMCLQRPYHPAKVLHLVHPSSSPQSSLVLIIKAINPPSVPLNLPPSLLRHSSMMTPRNHTCVHSRSYQPVRLPLTTTSSSD